MVADHGYEAYNVFAYFKEYTTMDFLIRIKQNKSAMREVRKLPMEEPDVDISLTLATNLLRSITADEIKELYHSH